jgi:hypothetical protein
MPVRSHVFDDTPPNYNTIMEGTDASMDVPEISQSADKIHILSQPQSNTVVESIAVSHDVTPPDIPFQPNLVDDQGSHDTTATNVARCAVLIGIIIEIAIGSLMVVLLVIAQTSPCIASTSPSRTIIAWYICNIVTMIVAILFYSFLYIISFITPNAKYPNMFMLLNLYVYGMNTVLIIFGIIILSLYENRECVYSGTAPIVFIMIHVVCVCLSFSCRVCCSSDD